MAGHIWLIGMMGSGKSAVARAAGARWNARHADTDDEVARRAGCSIAQLWGDRGEEAFRDMEEATIARLAGGEPAVIATGGGAVLRDGSVAAMRSSGTVVWLSAPPEVLSSRVGAGVGRPLLDEGATPEHIANLLEDRAGLYAAAAHVVIDVEAASVEEVVDRMEAVWKSS